MKIVKSLRLLPTSDSVRRLIREERKRVAWGDMKGGVAGEVKTDEAVDDEEEDEEEEGGAA